jgi:nicotinic acid phosphoribosyltransferase
MRGNSMLPIARYAYVDGVRVWFKQPLTSDEIGWLREQRRDVTGDGRYPKLRRHPWPAKFDRSYVERCNFYQPTEEVLRWLANREDALLNYVEISLDLIFENETEKETAARLVWRTIIKKHHGEQGIRFDDGTRYTAARGAPNLIAIYDDKPSKLTGDPLRARRLAHLLMRSTTTRRNPFGQRSHQFRIIANFGANV